MASQGCFQMPLTIGSHVFPSDLIILESQGLDVILGMDWLSMYGGNIDCASKSILLTTPEGKRIKYVSRHVPTLLGKKASSSAGFRCISSAGTGATNKALQLTHSSSACSLALLLHKCSSSAVR